MKYKYGTFVTCEAKSNQIFVILGDGEENGHSYYICKDIVTGSVESFLTHFLEEKFTRVSFFKSLLFYFRNLGKRNSKK